MTPGRIAIKLFTTSPEAPVELHPAIGLFHRFIQEGRLPGLLIDVADYAHVPEGPGVILIGHDVDYAIDRTGGLTGLLTTRKRAEGVPVEELFRDTLGRAAEAVRAIESDGALGLRFATDRLEIAFPDRLAAPNTDAAGELAVKLLQPAARAALGDGVTFERIGTEDPRRMLALRVHGIEADAEALLARLGRS